MLLIEKCFHSIHSYIQISARNRKFINFDEKYADLVCEDFPKKWLPSPETGFVPPQHDLVHLAETIAPDGFVEKYCLDEKEVKQIKLIRYYRNNYMRD